MDGVVLAGEPFRYLHKFGGNELEAFLVKARNNSAEQMALNGVWLYDY